MWGDWLVIQGAGQYKDAMANPCGRKMRKFHKSRREPSGAEDEAGMRLIHFWLKKEVSGRAAKKIR